MFGKATLVDGWMLVGNVTCVTGSGESQDQTVDETVDSNENHTHQRGNEKDNNIVSGHVSKDEDSEEEDSEEEDSEESDEEEEDSEESDEEHQPKEPCFEWRIRQVKDCKLDLSCFANKLATIFFFKCASMPGISKLCSGARSF